MRIVLCRHPQTEDNANRIYSGQNNVPLNGVGWGQSHVLADRIAGMLPGMPVGAVLSSDLQRASDLAQVIGERLGLRPITAHELREVNIGLMTGMVREVAMQEFPQERHRTANPHFDFTDIGGESAEDVLRRHLSFLRFKMRELSAHGVNRVVVVGHGTALRLVFCQRLGLIKKLHDQGDLQLVDMPLG